MNALEILNFLNLNYRSWTGSLIEKKDGTYSLEVKIFDKNKDFRPTYQETKLYYKEVDLTMPEEELKSLFPQIQLEEFLI